MIVWSTQGHSIHLNFLYKLTELSILFCLCVDRTGVSIDETIFHAPALNQLQFGDLKKHNEVLIVCSSCFGTATQIVEDGVVNEREKDR